MTQSQSLKEKTAKGLLWGGISNGGQQVLNLVFGIFLARQLSAADYGMVGMLTIFGLLATALQESGFISALNRKKDVTQADYNAFFWFNILCAGTLYILLAAAAPLIADFYHDPRLIPLARLTFLSFLIASFGTTPRAYLFRHMMVKQSAAMQLAAIFVSGVTGVTLAYCGFAYWGLAIQNIVYCLLTTVFAWWMSGWRPTLRIDLRPLRGMIGFSSRLLITNVFTGINNNIFSIFFGRFYGDRQVGLYTQANKWTGQGYSFLIGMLWGVTQPAFARLTDDVERQRRVFRKMLRFVAFVSCPALFGLALIAPEFITILITEKWRDSIPLMQMLCVGGAFIPIATFYSNYIVSQGRSQWFMFITIALCVAQTLSAVLLRTEGVTAMVVVYVALGILWVPVWHFFVRRLIGISFRQALADILPFVVTAGTAAGVAWLVAQPVTDLYLSLVVKAAVAVAVYVAFMLLFRVVVFRESVQYLAGVLRGKR